VLGHGKAESCSMPTLVQSLSNVIAIGASKSVSIAVTESGDLYSWGKGEDGQVGHDKASSGVPELVQSMQGHVVIPWVTHLATRSATHLLLNWKQLRFLWIGSKKDQRSPLKEVPEDILNLIQDKVLIL